MDPYDKELFHDQLVAETAAALVQGWDLIDEFTLRLRSADGRNVAIQVGPDEDIVYA